jgi:carbon-monoxide dehydrogenase large subunit
VTDLEAQRFVGSPVKRREDPRILTGRGRYVDDVVVPGMLHVAFVRSPLASADIVTIDTKAARELPGVVAVLTFDDFLAAGVQRPLPEGGGPPFPPLASGRVVFVGDPVALVVAESRALAEDGCELVEVDYETRPAVVGIDQARAEGAPVVHPGHESNVAGATPPSEDPEIDAVFASAAHVVTETLSQHRYVASPMETRGVVADWQPFPGQLTIWLSTQGAHAARDHFAQLLELPASAVRVVVGDVGGAFGLKIGVGREESAVALAARIVGRPLKWIEDRWENLVGAPHAREDQATISLALDEQGSILGLRMQHAENAGSYSAGGGGGLVVRLISGPYRIPHVVASSTSVRSNTSRRSAYRGPWMFETLGRETMVDIAARRIGMDPVELRRRNLLSADDLPYTTPSGMSVNRVTPRETLEQALAMLDYDAFRAEQAQGRRSGRYLGVGVSVYIEPSAMPFGLGATESCTIRIDPTGKVQVLTGANSQGHSIETTMVQVIADYLGVDMDDVVLFHGDTDAVPVGATTGGSRNAVFGGGAARQAAIEMKERVLHIASDMMEAAPEDLEMDHGVVSVKGTPSRAVTLAEVARLAYLSPLKVPADVPPGLEITTRFTTEGITWSNATHLCTCEVDPLTGKVTILRFIVSEDCGTMINPKVVEGQICGGVVQGIGGVLLENFVYDGEGNPQTTTFMDYLLPTAPEVPNLEYGHIETSSQQDGGWKGMGEGGAIGSGAAVINAVADALSPFGVVFTTQPLSPAAVVEAITAASGPSATGPVVGTVR